MFGYMTSKDALKNGFTNHGKYFGIPVWINLNDEFIVAAKWKPMEFVIIFFHYVEGFFRSMLYPDSEPVFQFLLGPEIDTNDNLWS